MQNKFLLMVDIINTDCFSGGQKPRRALLLDHFDDAMNDLRNLIAQNLVLLEEGALELCEHDRRSGDGLFGAHLMCGSDAKMFELRVLFELFREIRTDGARHEQIVAAIGCYFTGVFDGGFDADFRRRVSNGAEILKLFSHLFFHVQSGRQRPQHLGVKRLGVNGEKVAVKVNQIAFEHRREIKNTRSFHLLVQRNSVAKILGQLKHVHVGGERVHLEILAEPRRLVSRFVFGDDDELGLAKHRVIVQSPNVRDEFRQVLIHVTTINIFRAQEHVRTARNRIKRNHGVVGDGRCVSIDQSSRIRIDRDEDVLRVKVRRVEVLARMSCFVKQRRNQSRIDDLGGSMRPSRVHLNVVRLLVVAQHVLYDVACVLGVPFRSCLVLVRTLFVSLRLARVAHKLKHPLRERVSTRSHR